MGPYINNYNNKLLPKIPMGPHKSKTSNTMVPVISNEDVTLV